MWEKEIRSNTKFTNTEELLEFLKHEETTEKKDRITLIIAGFGLIGLGIIVNVISK